MEYWQQDKFKESCGFCPHRKPNVRDTYRYLTIAGNTGRYPFMNVGATYDGDFGNDFLFDGVEIDQEVIVAAPKTYHQLGLAAADDADAANYPPWTNGTGAMYFRFREPVMAEPLDYYSSRTGSKTMNNVTSIDLEYNFNNLRNMILFNKAKLLGLSKERRTDHATRDATTEIVTGLTQLLKKSWILF